MHCKTPLSSLLFSLPLLALPIPPPPHHPHLHLSVCMLLYNYMHSFSAIPPCSWQRWPDTGLVAAQWHLAAVHPSRGLPVTAFEWGGAWHARDATSDRLHGELQKQPRPSSAAGGFSLESRLLHRILIGRERDSDESVQYVKIAGIHFSYMASCDGVCNSSLTSGVCFGPA